MCGRYGFEVTAPALQERFDIEGDIPAVPARYNVAPTQTMPVVVHHSPNSVALMRWGLIPFWAKDVSVGSKMINARAETVAEKPAYRKALATHRCLVPASGFYEWQRNDRGVKVPYWIFCKDEPLFAFAGLHAAWKGPEDEWIHSYTIITTEANEVVAPIHGRMPVILDREDEALWLDPDQTEAERLLPLLRPYSSARMDAHAVSRQVNNPAFDTADLIRPEVNSK
jgi:putative SOS response-associated peptidase YedK